LAVTVRLAQPSDYAQAGSATAEAYAPFLDMKVPSQREYLDVVADLASRAKTQILFVAECEGKLVGSVSLALNTEHEVAPGASHVRMLGVAPNYEGLGAGRGLLRACVERSREAGKQTIGLRTMPPMQRAQHLYEKVGFQRYPEQDYSDGEWGPFLAYRLDF
jgi:ribosomal protein S18 acetylase RimI-like enzyme